MKLLKVLTILSFSLFISTAVIFSQENNTAVTGTDSIQDNGSKGNESGSEIEKSIITEKTEADKSIQSTEVKKKNSANESKSESLKAGNKKITEKKIIPESANVKEEKMKHPTIITRTKKDKDSLLWDVTGVIKAGSATYDENSKSWVPTKQPIASQIASRLRLGTNVIKLSSNGLLSPSLMTYR